MWIGNCLLYTSREGVLKSDKFKDGLEELFPILTPNCSDSATLDNAFELLISTGKSLTEAMTMLIPQDVYKRQGLLEEPSMDESLISHVYKEDLPILFENGTITGGMIPKINSCIDALNQGVKKVHILDGRVRHSIITELFTDAGVGTLID